MVLDAVHADRAALHADLERRLGGRLLRCVVTDVDYVQGTTRCDVRFRAAAAGSPAVVAPRPPRPRTLTSTHAVR